MNTETIKRRPAKLPTREMYYTISIVNGVTEQVSAATNDELTISKAIRFDLSHKQVALCLIEERLWRLRDRKDELKVILKTHEWYKKKAKSEHVYLDEQTIDSWPLADFY